MEWMKDVLFCVFKIVNSRFITINLYYPIWTGSSTYSQSESC